MANEVLLQEGHPVDENLRPLKVGGKATAIETAQNGDGARIRGDLIVTGEIKGKTDIQVGDDVTCDDITCDKLTCDQLNATNDGYPIVLSGTTPTIWGTAMTIQDLGDFKIDASADITLDAAGGDVNILQADLNIPVDKKVILGDAGEYIVGDNTDLDIVSSNDATIDAGGTIILDSADGTFEMHGAGATAKFADMYAGMILGYTDIGLNESHTSLDLTTSYVVPTDEFSVSFVAPPSGNVMIDFQIQYYMGSTGAGTLHAGLSTANATSGYAALQAYHEQVFEDTGSRSGITVVQGAWTITGLTAGASTEYWIGFKTISTAGTTAKIQWGGNVANRYPDFIMKATALPASITT